MTTAELIAHHAAAAAPTAPPVLPAFLSTRETVVIDTDGVARVRYTGSRGESTASVVANAIDRTLNGPCR